MNSIEEFNSLEKKESYYPRLVEELKRANGEFHAFNLINEGIRAGFPFSAKDNICVRGFEATCSSKILKGYVPNFSATAVSRLGSAFGFLGKTNMDEFGFGTFGINSEEPARNPFNSDYVTGGSSSGAAAATALMKYHVALAVSTGGSISSPASFCGVVGYTPTYGLVSRYGLIDYGNSLDRIGIIARSAGDVRHTCGLLRGTDRYDSTCVDHNVASDGKKTLFVINQLNEVLDERIRAPFESLLGKLENLGYVVKRVDLDIIGKAVGIYYIISSAEASTNLARYTGFKYGYQYGRFTEYYNDFFSNARAEFGIEAKRRIILGTFVRSASVRGKYYDKALRARRLLIDRMKGLLKDGYIISPTMPIKTPKIREVRELTPLQSYATDALTVPPNLCGFPHISFPFDYIDGMPIGAQIITDHFNDDAIIGFVEEWERHFKYRFKHNLGAL
ncbi:MAG: amidase family protein [Candidatus Marsarchaeota archaeon]|jgi:Asp-tRNAAsn/Glu-tRNAGln amidotransferase A subunit and related amidases|nr:amidase family protein [Candidatus Marsarchaeota archaeon]